MARPPADSISVETPTRLLQAAAVEFAARGYAAARLSDIADRAGIRRPSLLYHFATKELLYEAVVRATFARLAAALRESRSAPGHPVHQLAATTRAFDAFLEADPGAARIVVHELVAEHGPGRAILLDHVVPLVDEIEAWILLAAGPLLRDGVQVRAVILGVVSDGLLRAAAGPLRAPLWGPRDPDASWRHVRATLFREEVPC